MESDVQYVPHYDSLVYYARFGDEVKIGTTTQFWSRMRGLRPDDVLAVEPGGIGQERARHTQFRALHISAEMFRFDPELQAHVANLAQSYPVPPWQRGRLARTASAGIAPARMLDTAGEAALREMLRHRALAEAAETRQAAAEKHLRDMVKQAHHEAGISIAELGRELGKHRNTIRTWCA